MKMVIVSGASGSLGHAYVEHYQRQEDTICVTLSRRQIITDDHTQTHIVDLLDTAQVADAMRLIELSSISEILFIHPVGKFKFEASGVPEVDEDGDGIDDEVYASNIVTFENALDPLLEKIIHEGRSIPVTIAAFGSISDRYVIKYWQSYSRAKRILRQKMLDYTRREDVQVRGVFIEVSTTDTDKERELRPLADVQYWLTTEDLVSRSLVFLDTNEAWSEASIFNPVPGFDTNYYGDMDQVRKKWSKEMGRELT